MVANGLLDIEEQDILPSIITMHVIGFTIFYEILIAPSIYLVLILYILLGFHMIASQAVIVWVAERERGIRENGSGNHKQPWSTLYHVVQVVGVVGLTVSGYVGLAGRKCDDSVKGFLATQSFTTFWFAPVVVIPCLLSMLLTSLLRTCLKDTQTTGRRQDNRSFWRSSLGVVHVLLVFVWMSSLVFMVILLESTLRGNRSQINELLYTGAGWSFGQILPLVLNISPVWIFGKHVVDQFDFKDFKTRLWSFLDHIFSRFTPTNVSEIQVAPTPDGGIRIPEDINLNRQQHHHAPKIQFEDAENIFTNSSGSFASFNSVRITNDHISNSIVGNIYNYPPRKVTTGTSKVPDEV